MTRPEIQPWVLLERVVCWEIWQGDMSRVVLRIDKPHRLDEQPQVEMEARLIAGAPKLLAALELALPIISAERASIAECHTNRSGPHIGQISDPEALEAIENYDAALVAGWAAIAEARGGRS